MDIRELDRRAVATTVRLTEGVTAEHLDRSTPCAPWTLRQLLEHMVGQNEGFALASTGAPSSLATWRSRQLGSDPADTYAKAAALVTAAFAEPGVLDRDFWLPEIRNSAPFPGRVAIGFHFLDYVVHGWDVARSLDVVPEFDAEVLDVAAALAAQVPDDPVTRGPHGKFRARLEVADDAPILDRIVALTGRSPDWHA